MCTCGRPPCTQPVMRRVAAARTAPQRSGLARQPRHTAVAGAAKREYEVRGSFLACLHASVRTCAGVRAPAQCTSGRQAKPTPLVCGDAPPPQVVREAAADQVTLTITVPGSVCQDGFSETVNIMRRCGACARGTAHVCMSLCVHDDACAGRRGGSSPWWCW